MQKVFSLFRPKHVSSSPAKAEKRLQLLKMNLPYKQWWGKRKAKKEIERILRKYPELRKKG